MKAFGASMVGLRKKFAVQNYKQNIKVLTPDDNGTIRLFEGFEGKENKTLTLSPNSKDISAQNSSTYDITCCALSPNLDILFGTSDGELILHQTSINETHFLEKHKKEVSFCAFVNRLNRFVTASKDSTFRNYNNNYSRQYDTPKYEMDKDLPMGPIINCKIFSRERKAMIWCENASLFVIDLRTNHLIARCDVCEGSQINSADVTHNEELIATVSSDKSVTLWRSNIKSFKTKNNNPEEYLETNEIYLIRTLKTEDIPRSCRFCLNGEFLAIGHDSGKIKIWNFYGTGSNSLKVFKESHSDWVNDIAISPKGSLIVSISKSIKLWTNEGKLLQTFKTNGGSMSSIYTHFINNQNSNSDDFNTIITVDDAGVLYILQLMNFKE
jgi:WD40 repeat protein